MAATKTNTTKGNGITGNQLKVLKALASGASLTREELRRKTGINKGWSRMLGASSKEDGGVHWETSLLGRGLISDVTESGERTLCYKLTAKGKAALEKATAKPAKAE